MKIKLGTFLELSLSRLQRMAQDIEQAFERIPEAFRKTYTAPLDFDAPGAVPGITSESVTIPGVKIGDQVLVGAPNAAPAGFLPPVAEVTAADTILVHWFQFSGAAVDPDGSGGDYKLDVLRH